MARVNAQSLGSLDVPTPTYDRSALRIGIVHFGVGGFHRAHQAMYLDRLMNDGKALDWAICGVGVLPGDRRMHEVMQAQDCLYTLVVKHPDGAAGAAGDRLDRRLPVRARTTRRRSSRRWPTRATRIVSLTVTEGGYHVNPVTGEFDDRRPGHPARPASRAPTPSTMFGFVTAALAPPPRRGVAAVHGHVAATTSRATATSPAR